jgi:hypothetical protein
MNWILHPSEQKQKSRWPNTSCSARAGSSAAPQTGSLTMLVNMVGKSPNRSLTFEPRAPRSVTPCIFPTTGLTTLTYSNR